MWCLMRGNEKPRTGGASQNFDGISLSRPAEKVLSKLEGVKGGNGQWTARCPSHDDSRNSLSVSEGSDGKVLLTCHANHECTAESNDAALYKAQSFRRYKRRNLPVGQGPRRGRKRKIEVQQEKGRKMNQAEQNYYISNNIDLRDTRLEFDDLTDAENAWREYRPRPDAGDLYGASFWSHCPDCGEQVDMTVPYITCRCAHTADPPIKAGGKDS